MNQRDNSPWLTRRSLLAAGGYGLLISLLPPALRAAPSASCAEDRDAVLNFLAGAKQLLATCYYHAIGGRPFSRLPAAAQSIFQGALAQEQAHLDLLRARGGQPGAEPFYAPANLFDSMGPLLAALDRLEHGVIAAEVAAARRLAELGEPELAGFALQMLATDSEHRVLGRELSQARPDPRNDLCLERGPDGCLDSLAPVFAAYSRATSGVPIAPPTAAEAKAAAGPFACAPITVMAAAPRCTEALAEIVGLAATAEALAITFYYHAIRGPLFRELPTGRQWYLQAALDEERSHLELLGTLGGRPAQQQFFFDPAVFKELPAFLGVLSLLEEAFIAAYLAAAQRLARLNQPRLTAVVGQILGIEAEHRTLGRVMGRQLPPSERCLGAAPLRCLADAGAMLQPFLQGDAGVLRYTLPGPTAIAAAVGRFGCVEVQTVDG